MAEPVFTISIISVTVMPTLNELENVVIDVDWCYKCCYQNGEEEIVFSTPLKPPKNSSFIPYEELTKTDIIEWILAEIGVEHKLMYQRLLLNKLKPKPIVYDWTEKS